MKPLSAILTYMVVCAAGFFLLNKNGIPYADPRIVKYALPLMLMIAVFTYLLNRPIDTKPQRYVKYDYMRFIPYLSAAAILSVIIESLVTGHFSVLLLYSALLCFLIGYSEEGFFRRYLMTRLSEGGLSNLAVIMISSFVFAGLHMINVFGGLTMEQAFLQSLNALPFGLCAGILFIYTKHFWPLVCVHMTTDFTYFSSNVGTFYVQSIPNMIADGILLLTLIQIIINLWRYRRTA